MTEPTQNRKLATNALALTTKVLLPLAVLLAAVIIVAVVKGWPIVPFLHYSGPKHDPSDWCREHGVHTGSLGLTIETNEAAR